MSKTFIPITSFLLFNSTSFISVIFQLIPYKQKENPNYNIEIFTRIDNELNFIPLIRVTDKNGDLRTEKKLRNYGRDEFIAQMGNITIGKSSVRITPRKNQHTDFYDLTPIKIEW